MVGATFKRINVEQIKNFVVTGPPLAENDTIAQDLDKRTHLMDRAITMLKTQLILLAEYREALITAAVTDGIDVDTFDTDRHREETTA
jgi:type I restriction enzyme, S subunit